MKADPATSRSGGQRGFILVSAMLLLVVLTIFALSMFRSYGLQDKISGNVREKQRALHSAEGAQQYAENYLANLTTMTPIELVCNKIVVVNDPTNVQICRNQMTQAMALKDLWPISNTYVEPTQVVNLNAPTWNTYADPSAFYIYDAGASADGSGGEIYQIDAWADAAGRGTVAVVESTYLVKPTVRCLSC